MLSFLFSPYAEVAKFVAGPALACNIKTSMNLPTYPMSVSSSVTGAITLLGGISNLDAVISSSTSDFATVDPSIGVLGDREVKTTWQKLNRL